MNRTKLFMAITCTIAASLAFSASAYSGGNGTEQTPYMISNVADLTELATESVKDSLDGVYFVQTADITVNGEFSPVAPNENYPFKGNYNGMDYDLTGLNLASSGMFIYTEDAVLSNLDLHNAVIGASSVSGGIVVNALGETVIESCDFDGSVVFPASSLLGCNVGGIAGYVGENASVIGCTSSLEIKVEHSPLVLYAGGIAGYNKGNISECTANADFTALSDNYLVSLGGIAGENHGVITGCEATGIISGEIGNDVALLYIGGIAGHNNGGKIERTINKANLTAKGYYDYPGYIGGIAGYNQNGDIEVSSNNGSVGGTINYAGGVTGINYASNGTSTVNECLNIGEITVTNGITGGLVGGNLATDKSENVSTVSSSLNLYDKLSGNGAIGSVQTDFVGVSTLKNLYVRNLTDTNAKTLTDAELAAANNINGLVSEAWVYPGNGLLPALAVVKNLSKAEAIGASISKDAEKVAYTVYNPTEGFDASAVIVFMKDNRVIGTKIDNITAANGYSVHTADSSFAKDADSVKIIVVDSLTGLAPVVDGDNF